MTSLEPTRPARSGTTHIDLAHNLGYLFNELP